MSPTSEFATAFGNKYGFDPSSIIAIITAIMAIFENCPQSPQQVRAAVKNPSLFQQARATRAVMNELDGLPRWKARRIAQDLMQEAASQPDEKIDAVFAECQQTE